MNPDVPAGEMTPRFTITATSGHLGYRPGPGEIRGFRSPDASGRPTLWGMPRWEAFRCVAQALTERLPVDALIEAIEITDDSSVVTVWTSTPGVVIGRQGTTAEAIWGALRESIGREVRFLVKETKQPPDDGPE